ncbi:TrkH-domain-containing protein [Marasmius fiardii PR-910]|nr:TrkH-domain-containing protein [Marasmius fiardii PR-910]
MTSAQNVHSLYIRYYFEKKFEHIIAASTSRIAVPITDHDHHRSIWSSQITALFKSGRQKSSTTNENTVHSEKHEKERHGGSSNGMAHRLRPDMIRRMDDAPKLVNPSGWISEGDRIPMKRNTTIQSTTQDRRLSFATPAMDNTSSSRTAVSLRKMVMTRRLSDPGTVPTKSSSDAVPMHRFETISPQSRPPSPPPSQQQSRPTPIAMPRTQTIEFSLPRRRPPRVGTQDAEHESDRPLPEPLQPDDRRSGRRSSIHHPPLIPYMTNHTHSTYIPGPKPQRKDSGFGGFPMPHQIVHTLIKKYFPKFGRKLTRTVTIPRTMTITSNRHSVIAPGARPVPYVSFPAFVGRNSAFPMLTEEQLEELGGVEYRALNALLWIVSGYHLLVQLIPFVVIAPYISRPKWRDSFVPPQLHRTVSPVWFSLYQAVSAYTNTGTSLVDTSMIPFQTAYVMILLMAFLILAGNAAFPIFLRFTIWILSKLVPQTSRTHETLHFLLDHPRRCFIYLFPSHQTWFLLTIVVTLTFTDWFFFMVLDIGNPQIEQIPLGTRFLAGFLQGVAVRAAGFGIVPLAALAPGVKVLYVVMMYISVYPIAMSVRSTNVYEEQSLGVYNGGHNDDEESFEHASVSRVTVWSRYLTMHARRQLAFDMWWLCLAVFLVCIIERHEIDDPNNATWFNIFNIVFEVVSAYGTVGLSLGLPTANYSFCGAFRPLSKLIVCLVMLRGRHRGLPVAIDRAVMLPQEFQKHDEAINDDAASQFYARSTSRHPAHFSGSHMRREPSIVEEYRDESETRSPDFK